MSQIAASNLRALTFHYHIYASLKAHRTITAQATLYALPRKYTTIANNFSNDFSMMYSGANIE